MKKITITTYNFDELSEEAQKNAIENYLEFKKRSGSDNLFSWVTDELREFGLRLEYWDYCRNECEILFYEEPKFVIHEIMKNCGDRTKIYKIAQKYQGGILEKNKHELSDEEFAQYEDKNEELKREISKEYCRILNEWYDYQFSDERAIDYLSDGFEFYENGEIYS